VIDTTCTESVGVGRMFKSICLFVCLSVCPEHNSKMKDPKVFKLGIGHDLAISQKWYGFWIERSKVMVTRSISVNAYCLLACVIAHSTDKSNMARV